MAVTQLKDGRWICYYRVPKGHGGSRVKKEYFGRGAEGETAARARHEALGLKIRRPARPTSGPSFRDLAKSYFTSKSFSATSKTVLACRLAKYLLPAFGHRASMSLADQDIDAYVSTRRGQGAKKSTIGRELTDLKAILNWSIGRRPPLIPFNPIKKYKIPKPDYVIIRPPSVNEAAKIIKHAAPHLKRALILSYYLGLRPGTVELLSLQWSHVDLATGHILVSSAHKGGPVKRMVPIHPALEPVIKTWHKVDGKPQNGPLIHYRGKPVENTYTAWLAALKRAGIKRRLRPYDLRHAFVTMALENGADLQALADVVGSRPETLMKHYQHVSRAMHRKTVNLIPALPINGFEENGHIKYPQKTQNGQPT